MEPLSEASLAAIVAELDDDDTVGVALTGSHARGDPTDYSDVDVLRFVRGMPARESERYRLEVRDGRLFSITTTKLEEKTAELGHPERAIWAVPGLRQARVLLDREGSLAELKREAEAFSWEPLGPAADEYVGYGVMGYAEEVHKVLTGIALGRESTVLYGTLGLVLGLAEVVAVMHRVLVESDNSYLDQVQDAAGRDSAWTRRFRLAAGLDPGTVGERGIAGLRLYEETAALARPVLLGQRLEVVEHALAAISSSGLVDQEDPRHFP